MMQKEVLEGNKLIAEFMGWKSGGFARRSIFPFGKKTEYFKRGKNEIMPFITTFEYHLSWDWLMPVIVKIINQDEKDMNLEIRKELSCADFKGTYQEVIKFIKWHNTCALKS